MSEGFELIGDLAKERAEWKEQMANLSSKAFKDKRIARTANDEKCQLQRELE